MRANVTGQLYRVETPAQRCLNASAFRPGTQADRIGRGGRDSMAQIDLQKAAAVPNRAEQLTRPLSEYRPALNRQFCQHAAIEPSGLPWFACHINSDPSPNHRPPQSASSRPTLRAPPPSRRVPQSRGGQVPRPRLGELVSGCCMVGSLW